MRRKGVPRRFARWEQDGVGFKVAKASPKERRNPFIYTNEQLSKMCKFYIILLHFNHTSEGRIRKSMKEKGL
jgi:hypothetical protein